MTSSSSSVQQAKQALGQRLREIRKDAGITARELAHRAGWHESKCSRLEHGRTPPSDADIRAWTYHCGALDQTEDLIATARGIQGMYVEWRRIERAGLKRAQESVVPLFERTRVFRAYSSWLVPGPLQTEGYTRALLRATARRRGLVDDVEQALTVRMERSRILRQGSHRFAFLIEESALRKRIGGIEVMAGQLAHLITVATLPSMSLGVIPDHADRSAIPPVEDFWIFDDAQVNVELVSAYLNVTQPHEVSLYARTFGLLQGLAVYGATARGVITSAINALG
ncbi:helix-turn-helix transcriptional regulator [Streptomyces sp. ET3-23]|nr:helix-turn-helix transcriptional regulator [Streptomyces sp. ET3-23]